MWHRIAGLVAVSLLAWTAGAQPPHGIAERVRVTGLTFPHDAVATGDVAIQRVFPRVSFVSPLLITAAPGDASRLFVVTQSGRIHIIPNQPDPAASTVFLDISDRVTQRGNEEGLLGLAFHPDYASNGLFYVNYIHTTDPRRTIISRFSVSADPDLADPGSETVLLTYDQPFANHNGGGMAFGPDGMLYIASGDGGSGNDTLNSAQNLGRPLGKFLRIRGDGSIPPDNPFVGVAGARGEIWAWGFRNPWRFSFDRATGVLWAGDVGQNAQEEIDIVRRGRNYGWRIYEGNLSNINPDNLPPEDFEAPIFTYDHVVGRSVTGGYVYRGSAIPSLVGQYVYGDFIAGQVWALVRNGGAVTANVPLGTVRHPSSFGEGADGEIYITSLDGGIFKLVPNGGGPAFPAQLSQTGLFTDLASLTPTPGLIEYDVNAPLWSDGASKRRWLALPGLVSQIVFTADGNWRPPRHTVLVKHFEITLADGSDKRLETRVLIRHDSGWHGYTYRWNAAGTDAHLLDGAESVVLDVQDPGAPGGSRLQTYEFPSRGACLGCHTSVAGNVLGLRTRQINRDFDYDGVVDNQLRAWNHVELFKTDIGAPGAYAAHPDPYGTAAPVAARARAYLDANCSQCHRPGGATAVDIDLRATVATAKMHTHKVRPTTGDLGIVNARRIAPGAKERSVLWERMRRLDGTRMPPLASHVVDQRAVDLIGEWIDAGAP